MHRPAYSLPFSHQTPTHTRRQWRVSIGGLFLLASLTLSGCYSVSPTLTEGANVAALQAHHLAGGQHEQKRDYPRAYSSYLEAAKAGYAPSQAALGFLYLNGLYGNKQEGLAKLVQAPDAKFWFELAAAQDDAAGQYGMGELYYYGKSGVARDTQQALSWYERAAQQGDVAAQVALAQLYLHGQKEHNLIWRGRTHFADRMAPNERIKNPQKGGFWLEQAADQGDAQSQYELARAYQQGNHRPADARLAQQWYERAAALGHYQAKLVLMLQSGEAGHYSCYVRGPYGIPMRQPGIARRPDDWCL